MEKTTRYITGVPVRSKEQFLRDCYVKLYAAKDVDEEIDTIQLSEPSVETTVEITQETTFDVSYQVKVGYHYTESGTVTDTYEVNGEKRSYEFERSETHTDWKDHSGTEKDVTVKYQVPLNDTEHWRFSGKEEPEVWPYWSKLGIRSIADEARFEEAPAEVAEKLKAFAVDHQELAEDTAKYDCFEAIRKALPGDDYRDFQPQWTATKMAQTVASLDSYKSTFTYREKQYSVERFVSKDYYYGVYQYREPEPKYTHEQLMAKREELLKAGGKDGKEKKVEKYITYGAVAVAAIGFVTQLHLLTVLGIAAVIVMAVRGGKKTTKFLGDRKDMEETAKQMLEEAADRQFAQQQEKKMELLNQRFAKMGTAPLTEEERAQFGPEKADYFENYVFSR